MKNKIFIIFLVAIFSTQSYLTAQNKSISATIEPKQILIGQQATIDIKVNSAKGELVLFPILKDTIVSGLEVLNNDLPIDTTMTPNGWTLSKKYIVTSFDSLDYHIPQIPAIVGIDTLRTDTMSLIVREPVLSDSTLSYIDKYKKGEIDSLNFEALGLNDIKPVITPPFVFMDYIEYVIYPLIIIFVLALLILLFLILKRKKKKGYFFTPKVVLPPDIVALNSLDKLKEKQLVKNGLIKEYHTEITNILRTYIKDRFGIDATEMLTSEIVESLGKVWDQKNDVDLVKETLELADLVKFAKFQPLTNENDRSLSDSYTFVRNTKIVEPEKQAESGKGSGADLKPENKDNKPKN